MTVPPLWPSNKAFFEAWDSTKQHFKIKEIKGATPSASWKISRCIRWICTQPFYQQFIEDPENLEVIVRGDSAKIGGKKASFLLLTLRNFGVFSKCPAFNFIVNLTEV